MADLVELAIAGVELAPEWTIPPSGTITLVPLGDDDTVGGLGDVEIVVGRPDAEAVREALAGVEVLRPRTHDLLLAVVATMGGEVVAADLVAQRPGGLWLAALVIRLADGTERRVDARPSDALNVALRAPGAILRGDPAALAGPQEEAAPIANEGPVGDPVPHLRRRSTVGHGASPAVRP